MLTNVKNNFCDSTAIETGLSDFHKMTITVLKGYMKKQTPRQERYRCYKNFNETDFRNSLRNQFNILDK